MLEKYRVHHVLRPRLSRGGFERWCGDSNVGVCCKGRHTVDQTTYLFAMADPGVGLSVLVERSRSLVSDLENLALNILEQVRETCTSARARDCCADPLLAEAFAMVFGVNGGGGAQPGAALSAPELPCKALAFLAARASARVHDRRDEGRKKNER